jgi:sRNA-binding protein
MTDTPAPQIDLIALYPDCFDLNKPRPLKIGIRQDLLATGHDLKTLRCVIGAYCRRRAYLKAMVAGAIRIDLQGQPAGEVTESDAADARDKLALLKPVKSAKPKPEPTPVLPTDAPLTAESIVSGRLELTVKFNELPQPVVVKAGMKIGIQTDTALVVTTLKPKAWKKLEKAQADWSQWVASMTGKLGAQVNSNAGSVVMLEDAAVQVFEKKVKVEVKE